MKYKNNQVKKNDLSLLQEIGFTQPDECFLYSNSTLERLLERFKNSYNSSYNSFVSFNICSNKSKDKILDNLNKYAYKEIEQFKKDISHESESYDNLEIVEGVINLSWSIDDNYCVICSLSSFVIEDEINCQFYSNGDITDMTLEEIQFTEDIFNPLTILDNLIYAINNNIYKDPPVRAILLSIEKCFTLDFVLDTFNFDASKNVDVSKNIVNQNVDYKKLGLIYTYGKDDEHLTYGKGLEILNIMKSILDEDELNKQLSIYQDDKTKNKFKKI